MTTARQRSGTIAFQPRARLLKLIGEELISDDVVAISELVKNAYDADASEVKITFQSVIDPGGTIIVRDNGCGMDLDTLLGCWMQPAGSTKVGKTKRKSKKRRRLLGEKGVGRFAVDKISNHLTLTTKCRSAHAELIAEFDWDKFNDDDRMLDDIQCTWRESRDGVRKTAHGTELRMSGLRSRWNERMFRRMSARLSRLLSPFRDRDQFRIVLESNDFPDYSGELRHDYLDAAPYYIEAQFDGKSIVEMRINGGTKVSHPWNGIGTLNCGPVRLRISAFDLEIQAIRNLGVKNEVRAWIKEWSGISVYRDSFRLWPYGEPHDDWLRLDQRRVNNPAVRLSNNQVVGFIDISRKENPDLTDQTNREGLVHNQALDDLRRLSLFVLQVMEAERQRYRRGDLSTGGKNGQAVARFDNHSKNGSAAVQDLDVKKLVAGYSELAAVGTAAFDMEACISPQLDQIRLICGALRVQVSGKGSRPVHRQLAEVEELVAVVKRRLSVIQPLANSTRRRARTIDVAAETLSFQKLMVPVLDPRNIRLVVDQCEDRLVRITINPEDFHRILYILCANSQDWLHGISKPLIRITNQAKDGAYEMIFSDNGPGVPAAVAESIFEPMFALKEKGRGMGLTIARQIITRNKGEIVLDQDGRRNGANFKIRFPLKGGSAKRGQ